MAGTRTFTMTDQQDFARWSGDYNPIHIDPVRARRTMAGAPVVHGVHLLIWALDSVGLRIGVLPPVARLQVKFSRFVHVGDEVSVEVTDRTPTGMRLAICSGAKRADVKLTFGDARTDVVRGDATGGHRFDPGNDALDNSDRSIDNVGGSVAFADGHAALAARYPNAARWIGSERLAALGATTRLVGMIYPGLHSIFAGLDLATIADTSGHALDFATGALRHNLIVAKVVGGGLQGTLDCIARTPPQRQASAAELVTAVPTDAFAGARVLVVGGSRGLGEIVAKLAAAGGAEVTITYRVGEAEAQAVIDDIRAAGGRCKMLRYDAALPAGPQLGALTAEPSHVYFFATPVIAEPNSSFFDIDRLNRLQGVFLQGFWNLAAALPTAGAPISIFYPSTVFINDRPAGMAEYAMAKAAGELMCEEINAAMPHLRVMFSRLPRMITDQTAGLGAVDAAPVVATLLPIVTAVQTPPHDLRNTTLG